MCFMYISKGKVLETLRTKIKGIPDDVIEF